MKPAVKSSVSSVPPSKRDRQRGSWTCHADQRRWYLSFPNAISPRAREGKGFQRWYLSFPNAMCPPRAKEKACTAPHSFCRYPFDRTSSIWRGGKTQRESATAWRKNVCTHFQKNMKFTAALNQTRLIDSIILLDDLLAKTVIPYVIALDQKILVSETLYYSPPRTQILINHLM
jgi:hypothetical protein